MTKPLIKPYKVVFSTNYKRDYKRLQKRNKDVSLLTDIMELLINQKKLPEKNRDHSLKGNFEGKRECQIAPDWLLLYEIDQEKQEVHFFRTGTHREVLGIE